jgi:hypothetical protein
VQPIRCERHLAYGSICTVHAPITHAVVCVHVHMMQGPCHTLMHACMTCSRAHLTCRPTGSGCQGQQQAHCRGQHSTAQHESMARYKTAQHHTAYITTIPGTIHGFLPCCHGEMPAALLPPQAHWAVLPCCLLCCCRSSPAVHSRAHHGACGIGRHLLGAGCGGVQACRGGWQGQGEGGTTTGGSRRCVRTDCLHIISCSSDGKQLLLLPPQHVAVLLVITKGCVHCSRSGWVCCCRMPLPCPVQFPLAPTRQAHVGLQQDGFGHLTAAAAAAQQGGGGQTVITAKCTHPCCTHPQCVAHLNPEQQQQQAAAVLCSAWSLPHEHSCPVTCQQVSPRTTLYSLSSLKTCVYMRSLQKAVSSML